MTKKENKVFVVASITIIFLLFLSLFCGKVFSKQIKELEKDSNSSNANTVDIKWEEIYPYDIEISSEGVPAYTTAESTSKIGKLTNILSDFGNFGNNWSQLMYKYSEISKTGYIISSRLSDPSISNSYIKLRNGYWVNASNSKLDYNKAINGISNYYYLQKYLETKGIDFLYFYTPTKECAIDNQLPDGVSSYANENIDTYIAAMKEKGINYVDLRENLHDDNLDHYSLFYKTDHHWNIDGGFWATSEIEKELNERFNIDIKDVYQLGTFSRTTYKNAMFGSEGHSVTHFNEQSEDFDILFPDFDNNFSLEIPDINLDVTGSFEDIFIDYEGLNIAIEDGGGYAYQKILHGNRPYEKIVNLNNPDGPKILMIRDSFSIAVAPYLALSCSELVLLDTRSSNGNFTGSIVNCIGQFEPDVVLAFQSSPQEITLNKKQ